MKNRLPLVSVGIPTYNRSEGLRRTLKCITGQTYKNLEIIVSDNCSPRPETEAIVREFMAKDSRIQYFRQEENKGAIFNFKFVLEKATGEYFMWASDDDLWKDNHIDALLNILKDSDAILAISRWNNIDPDNSLFFHDWPALSIIGKTHFDTFLNFLIAPQWKVSKACFIYGLIKTTTLKKVNFPNPIHQDIGNDVATILELLCYGNIKYIKNITWSKKYNYYMSSPSSLRTKIKKSIKILLYLLGFKNQRAYHCENFYSYVNKLINIHFNSSKKAKFYNLLNKYRLLYIFY